MELGMIGLGRMPSNMVRRLMRAGHHRVVYDLHPDAVLAIAKDGAIGATSFEDFASKLKVPRTVWMMVPAADTAEAPRTPGREEVGGAGHFVKMVHNGIEYGIMASYAERLNILKHANVGKQKRTADAETAPLRHPEHYPYTLNLPDIAEVWRRGSVIASWLLDLTAAALLDSPDLAKFAGRVSDSGEGRWTIAAAIDESVPAPVLPAALYERFSSRGEADFGDKVLSALRYQFGGHEEKAATKAGA
jgi:6-phosphogluconate dehydrogenase